MNAKKITITKADGGRGVLTKMADGRWCIELNGKSGGSLYYSADQIESIVAKARAAGSNVVIEE